MAVLVPEILTEEFFSSLSDEYETIGDFDEAAFIDSFKWDLAKYAEIMFDKLMAMDKFENMLLSSKVDYVFMCIGESFHRIFSALEADYNPLENFFTNRTLSNSTSGSNTKTGGYTDTPSGSKTRSYTDHGNIGQGTTFESYGDNDFRNISKTKSNGTVSDSFTNYQEQRTYNQMKDTISSSGSITENKNGNSGIFSKQDLTTREIHLRLKNQIAPILVRMCVDVINKGVWADDD